MWSKRERQKFIELMTAASENYGKPISGALMDMLIKTLQRYPFEIVQEALEYHMTHSPYMIKLNDFIDYINRRGMTPEEAAEMAWAEVKEAMGSIGGYQSIKFRDPVINATIRHMGGWPALCDMEMDQLENAKWEFRRIYTAFLKQGKVPEVGYLPGRAEQANAGSGYCTAFTVMVFGEPRNSHIQLVESEFTVKLPENARLKAFKVRRELPRQLPRPEAERPMSPEELKENVAKLKEMLSKVGRPMPEAEAVKAN